MKMSRKGEHWCLVEALRRYLRFHHDCPITQAWTGLGSKTQYRQALEAGLMTYATTPHPGYMTWWRLTERGAGIVMAWIGAGWTVERVERGDTPPPFAYSENKSHCGATSCWSDETTLKEMSQ